MQTKLAAVALAALAGTASAQNLGAVHANILEARNQIVRVIEARQTAVSGLPACVTALESIGASVPTPPPDVMSFEATQTQTDPCKFTLPASLSSEYASYESQLQSWASAHSGDLMSALSQCPQYSSMAGPYTGFTATVTNCNGGSTTITGGNGGGGGGGSGTTATSGTTAGSGGSGSSSGSGSGSATKNVGPRETGFLAGAVAAAGVVAAVAVAL